MTDDEMKDKAAYAAFLLQCQDNAFEAALKLYPGDTGRALRVSNFWPMDAFVIEERARLSLNAIEYLPTKADLAILTWNIAKDGTKHCTKDRLAAAKLYGEIMGYVAATAAPVEPERPPQTAPVYKIVNE